MVDDVYEEKEEVREVEEEDAHHSNPARQVVEVDGLTQSVQLILLNPRDQHCLHQTNDEEEQQNDFEHQFVDVAFAGDVGPRQTEPHCLHNLQGDEHSDLRLLVLVEDGETQDHQELLVVGEKMVVVGAKEVFRGPLLEGLSINRLTSYSS